MAKYTKIEGTGIHSQDAKEDLYARAQEIAQEQGLQLPKNFDTAARRYTVSVRDAGGHKGYFTGKANADFEKALQSALEAAGISKGWNMDRHRVRIVGEYELQPTQTTAKGDPSGAAPPVRRTGDITNLL